MSDIQLKAAVEGERDQRMRRPFLSPLNQRRWQNFKANRRGYWSLWIFLVLFILSLFAEFIANDKPIIASYKGEILFPVLVDYPEEKFGGFYAVADYRDPVIRDEIEAHGWMIWPPIRYSYTTVNNAIPEAAPARPSWRSARSARRTTRSATPASSAAATHPNRARSRWPTRASSSSTRCPSSTARRSKSSASRWRRAASPSAGR